MSKQSGAGPMERAVLRRLILDLGSDDELYFRDAVSFLDRPEFIHICKSAGYPDTLVKTLSQMVQESQIQRKLMAKEVLKALAADYQ
jgi:hypothetical protein